MLLFGGKRLKIVSLLDFAGTVLPANTYAASVGAGVQVRDTHTELHLIFVRFILHVVCPVMPVVCNMFTDISVYSLL